MVSYCETMLSDTAKLRALKSDGTFTELCAFVPEGKKPFDAQDHLIKEAYIAAERGQLAVAPGKGTGSLVFSASMSDMADDAAEDMLFAADAGSLGKEEPKAEKPGKHAASSVDAAAQALKDAANGKKSAGKGKAAATPNAPAASDKAKAKAEPKAAPEPKAEAAKAPELDEARQEIMAKIAETLDGEELPASTKPEPVGINEEPGEELPSETASQPKKKGFFSRLFGK